MNDRLPMSQMDQRYQAKGWKRGFPMYGYRFAFAGVAILTIVGMFAFA
jgi:hypothetical protein